MPKILKMSQSYILRINYKKSLLLSVTKTICFIFEIFRYSKERQILHFKKMDKVVLESIFQLGKIRYCSPTYEYLFSLSLSSVYLSNVFSFIIEHFFSYFGDSKL